MQKLRERENKEKLVSLRLTIWHGIMAVRDEGSCCSPTYFPFKKIFSARQNILEIELGLGPHSPESNTVFH